MRAARLRGSLARAAATIARWLARAVLISSQLVQRTAAQAERLEQTRRALDALNGKIAYYSEQ